MNQEDEDDELVRVAVPGDDEIAQLVRVNAMERPDRDENEEQDEEHSRRLFCRVLQPKVLLVCPGTDPAPASWWPADQQAKQAKQARTRTQARTPPLDLLKRRKSN